MRPRIVFVNYYCVESHRREIYRAVARESGWEVHVVAPRVWQEQGPPITAEPELSGDIVLHTLGTVFHYRAHRVLYRGLSRLLRELTPDFLYMHTEPENYAMLQALACVRFASRKTKLGVYSHRMYDYPRTRFPYKANWTHRLCDMIAGKFPADMLFYAPAVAKDFIEPYARRICYMPYSVDTETFAPQAVREEKNHPVIGYVGRVVEGKGLHLLINALQALPPNTRLRIVGEGPLRGELIRLVQYLGLSERVSFEYGVPYAQVPSLLHQISVLVLPSIPTGSWSEQFGRILIEAMACGVPVVGSDSASIPEVIGEAGYLFRTGDSDDLAQKLMILLSQPESYEGAARRGRERALHLYSTRTLARQMVESIKSVM